MKGFTLIECLITVLIISILMIIGIPIYSQYIVKERRIEAEVALMTLAARLETYATLHNTYQDATFEILKVPSTAAHHHYQLKMSLRSDDYQLEAEPDPAGDVACGTLTLNALGEKGINGHSNLDDCW